jgi:hypothetical protein
MPTSAPVDQMLPPGASSGPIPSPGAEVALPSQQAAAQVAATQNQKIEAGEDEILIPTEDGQTAVIRNRPKTIFDGEEEVELREMTPEEKSKKRTKKNLFVWTFCVLVLFAVVAILLYYGPL